MQRQWRRSCSCSKIVTYLSSSLINCRVSSTMSFHLLLALCRPIYHRAGTMKVTSVSETHCRSVGYIDTKSWQFERSPEVCFSCDVTSNYISRVALHLCVTVLRCEHCMHSTAAWCTVALKSREVQHWSRESMLQTAKISPFSLFCNICLTYHISHKAFWDEIKKSFEKKIFHISLQFFLNEIIKDNK